MAGRGHQDVPWDRRPAVDVDDKRSCRSGPGRSAGETGKWQWAGGDTRAGDEVLAAGLQRSLKRAADGVQVGDLGVHLGQLGPGVPLEHGVGWLAVAVLAGLQKGGDGVQHISAALWHLDVELELAIGDTGQGEGEQRAAGRVA